MKQLSLFLILTSAFFLMITLALDMIHLQPICPLCIGQRLCYLGFITIAGLYLAYPSFKWMWIAAIFLCILINLFLIWKQLNPPSDWCPIASFSLESFSGPTCAQSTLWPKLNALWSVILVFLWPYFMLKGKNNGKS